MSEPLAPTEPVPDDFIVSDDPVRPTVELVADIRERLAARAADGDAPLPPFPRFGGRADLLPADELAAQHLAQAASLLAEMETTPILAPSPATQLPFIGRLWGLVRNEAHSLVLFYVNKQAAQTARLQQHLLNAVHALALETARQRETIERLQRKLEELGSTEQEDG